MGNASANLDPLCPGLGLGSLLCTWSWNTGPGLGSFLLVPVAIGHMQFHAASPGFAALRLWQETQTQPQHRQSHAV